MPPQQHLAFGEGLMGPLQTPMLWLPPDQSLGAQLHAYLLMQCSGILNWEPAHPWDSTIICEEAGGRYLPGGYRGALSFSRVPPQNQGTVEARRWGHLQQYGIPAGDEVLGRRRYRLRSVCAAQGGTAGAGVCKVQPVKAPACLSDGRYFRRIYVRKRR